ncbi:MAG: BrnA antitoxin family protein [bacterium]
MKRKPISRKSRTEQLDHTDHTDYGRLASMKDEDIDFSDIPEITPEMFARAIRRRNFEAIPCKKQLTLRVDSDVVDWYKKQGKGYQTRINSLLRAYMKEHQRKTA